MFEAFAGIGAQRKALSEITKQYKIVGMAEWYVPAIVAYQAIHNKFKIIKNVDLQKIINYLDSKPLSINSKTLVAKGYWKRKKLDELRIVYSAVFQSEKEGNIFDIQTLYKRTLKGIDLLTYSFPCQDLSQQGKQRGMSKNIKSRSGLLWEIEKALDKTSKTNLPKFLLMENVVALSYKNNAKDLNMWIKKLEKLGYKNDIKILNAAKFGSPQARRRVFMLSTLNKLITLPNGNKKPKAIKTILEKDKSKIQNLYLPALYKYDQTEYKVGYYNIKKTKLKGYTSFNSETYVYDIDYTGPTLTASGANSRIKIFIDNDKIRKLGPKEAFQYMGFSKWDFNKVNKLNYLNETKLIFLAGNSIAVEVLREIFRKVV